MSNREYGFVTVQKQSGKWKAVVGYVERDENGKVTKRGRKAQVLNIASSEKNNRGKENALKLAEDFRKELVAGEPSRAKQAELAEQELLPEHPTVAQYMKYYLDVRLPSKKPDIEPSTMTGYRRYEKYIAADWDGVCIGKRKLEKLNIMQIEQWRNQMQKHLAPVSVKAALALLNRALAQAVQDELIRKNPAASVDPPAQAGKRPNWIEVEERIRLGSALEEILAAEKPDHNASKANALGIKIALLTGMRQGEICGLRWSCVSFTGNGAAIKVEQSIGRDGNRFYIKAPKTERGIRTVHCGQALTADLMARKQEMQAKAKAGEIVWSDDMFVLGEPVWNDKTNSWYYLKPKRLAKMYQHLVRRLDIRGANGETPTFHDMRHTFATEMATAGMDKQSLKAEMGHSSISVTEQYYISENERHNREEALRLQNIILPQEPLPKPEHEVINLRPTGTEQ